MKYCCDYMKERIICNDTYLTYSVKFREYGVRCSDGGTAVILFEYCPWCASKLPRSLRKQWFNIIRNEYKLQNPWDDKRKIPKDFRTDAWWKKRGL